MTIPHNKFKDPDKAKLIPNYPTTKALDPPETDPPDPSKDAIAALSANYGGILFFIFLTFLAEGILNDSEEIKNSGSLTLSTKVSLSLVELTRIGFYRLSLIHMYFSLNVVIFQLVSISFGS